MVYSLYWLRVRQARNNSYRNKISKANIALVIALAAIVDLDKDKENEEIA